MLGWDEASWNQDKEPKVFTPQMATVKLADDTLINGENWEYWREDLGAMDYAFEENDDLFNESLAFDQAVIRALKIAQFDTGDNSGSLSETDAITITWTDVEQDNFRTGTTGITHVLSDNTVINGITHWADIKADAMKADYFATEAYLSLSDLDQEIVQELVNEQTGLSYFDSILEATDVSFMHVAQDCSQ